MALGLAPRTLRAVVLWNEGLPAAGSKLAGHRLLHVKQKVFIHVCPKLGISSELKYLTYLKHLVYKSMFFLPYTLHDMTWHDIYIYICIYIRTHTHSFCWCGIRWPTMGFSGQLAKSSGCLRIVGEMVTRVRGELRASNRIAENILGIGSWRWWMWTIFLIWKNRANNQTAKMVLFVENNCFDFAEMVLRGPHIPDSPGTGSVSVFFVDPRGEPSARELHQPWVDLDLVGSLFSFLLSRLQICH